MKYHPAITHMDSRAFRRRQQQRAKQWKNTKAMISTLTDMGMLAQQAERMCADIAASSPINSEVLQQSVFG